jgi:hypothetical protein
MKQVYIPDDIHRALSIKKAELGVSLQGLVAQILADAFKIPQLISYLNSADAEARKAKP